MKSYWLKLGQLYSPEGPERHFKLLSHAANPLPIHLEGDIYRIFFSGRDSQNRSSVGAVDVDISNKKVIKEHEQPFFNNGPIGSFYSDGVSVGNCYVANGRRYMLFMGWQAPKNGHWRGDIGRLIVNHDLTLSIDSDIPLLSFSSIDPISLSYPWVHQMECGKFIMWYGSTITWSASNQEMVHVINSASSSDGHHWTQNGLAVPYKIGVAQAFSRPTVIKNSTGEFEMWFSYRSGSGQKYRIGKAVSLDGQKWELALDESGIDVSEDGWDSEMIEYPFVFDHKGRRYMLYNGNQYGKTGFGLAELIC